jgi:DNA-binding SARP family transcriptional activator
MNLILLGDLKLEPSEFTRPKPLLLLAYLSLEGARSRREVAELFWQGSKDPMQGLRMALLQLKDVPEAVRSDEKKVWTDLPSDVATLQAHLSQGNLVEALALYKGPFLEGFDLADNGEELEEWIFQTRERVASDVRGVMVELAEQEARRGDFKNAAVRAEGAYLLRFAPEPDSALLGRIYTLLRSNENPQAESVSKEARAYDLELDLTPEESRRKLQSVNLGPTSNSLNAAPAQSPSHQSPSHQSLSNAVNPLGNITSSVRRRPVWPWRIAGAVSLLVLAGLLLAFFGQRDRTSVTKAGLEADDADVALNNGDNYFCTQHSQLFCPAPILVKVRRCGFGILGCLNRPRGKQSVFKVR